MRSQPSRLTSLFAWLSTARVENTTSSAVKGTPSDQRTPWRRCQVMVSPSALMPPLARVGTTVVSSGTGRLWRSNLVSHAIVSEAMKPSVVCWLRCGLRLATSSEVA